jgi:hypothetical protein
VDSPLSVTANWNEYEISDSDQILIEPIKGFEVFLLIPTLIIFLATTLLAVKLKQAKERVEPKPYP